MCESTDDCFKESTKYMGEMLKKRLDTVDVYIIGFVSSQMGFNLESLTPAASKAIEQGIREVRLEEKNWYIHDWLQLIWSFQN